MRKLVILAISALLVANVSAQEQKKECKKQFNKEERVEFDIKRLTNELLLSDEQAVKFAVLYREYAGKLDELFHMGVGTAKFRFYNVLPDATGLMGMFQMGNEPSFHIPYLYDYLGAPWKTQKRIHMVIDSQFNDTWYGIPGDEDGGGMSSFLVFSMMGFFPVTPGIFRSG